MDCGCVLPDAESASDMLSDDLFSYLKKPCCDKLSDSESESQSESDSGGESSDGIATDDEEEIELSKRPGGSWANIHRRSSNLMTQSKKKKLVDKCKCDDQGQKKFESTKSKSALMRDKAYGRWCANSFVY